MGLKIKNENDGSVKFDYDGSNPPVPPELINDIFESITGFDPQKKQVLKNIFGSFTWVTEGAIDPEFVFLTVVINGLPDVYQVAVNGEIWVNNKKAFLLGTVLDDITPTVTGYFFTPASAGDIVMDADKSVTFLASPDSPGSDLLPGYILLPNDAENAGGDRTLTESPEGQFNSDTSIHSGNPLKYALKFEVISSLAMRASSRDVFLGLGETGDSLFVGLRIYFGVTAGGKAICGTTGGQYEFNPQPAENDFIVMKTTDGRIFQFYAVTPNHVTTLVYELDLGYNVVGFGGIVKGTFGSIPAKFVWPQSQNLTLLT